MKMSAFTVSQMGAMEGARQTTDVLWLGFDQENSGQPKIKGKHHRSSSFFFF